MHKVGKHEWFNELFLMNNLFLKSLLLQYYDSQNKDCQFTSKTCLLIVHDRDYRNRDNREYSRLSRLIDNRDYQNLRIVIES